MTYDIGKTIAWNFLESHPLGTLATLGSDGQIQMAAIYFFPEKDFSCYFVTKEATRKFINAQERKVATLLSFDEDELLSVEIAGEVTLVSDTISIAAHIEKFQNLASIRKAGYWIPPIAQINAGAYVVCKLTPNMVVLNNFSEDATDKALPKQLSFDPRG